MTAVNLTYWLRKSPQPAAVLADEQRIEVPRNRRAYNDLTATIQALEPSKLTCLDAKGNVIRSIKLLEEADGGEESPPPSAAVSAQQSDLQLFSRLLAQAYEHARSSPLLESAMQFVERTGERLARAEAENERLHAIIHKQQARILELSAIEPAEGDGGEGSIMGALVAGALQAQQQQGALVPLKGAKTK